MSYERIAAAFLVVFLVFCVHNFANWTEKFNSAKDRMRGEKQSQHQA